MGGRLSGRPLAATNVKTPGSVCKRRDAVHLGRKKGLQPRASERPAVACSAELGGQPRETTELLLNLKRFRDWQALTGVEMKMPLRGGYRCAPHVVWQTNCG